MVSALFLVPKGVSTMRELTKLKLTTKTEHLDVATYDISAVFYQIEPHHRQCLHL